MVLGIAYSVAKVSHLHISGLLVVEVHADMRAHTPERIPAVPTDSAAECLHSSVSLHMPLSRCCGRRYYVTARALPPPFSSRRDSWLDDRSGRDCAPRRSGLPLRTIVRLMCRQIVQRAKVYPTCEADQLSVLWRWTRLWGRTRSLLPSTSGTIVTLVDPIVLILAEHYVTFLTFRHALLDQDLR